MNSYKPSSEDEIGLVAGVSLTAFFFLAMVGFLLAAGMVEMLRCVVPSSFDELNE